MNARAQRRLMAQFSEPEQQPPAVLSNPYCPDLPSNNYYFTVQRNGAGPRGSLFCQTEGNLNVGITYRNRDAKTKKLFRDNDITVTQFRSRVLRLISVLRVRQRRFKRYDWGDFAWCIHKLRERLKEIESVYQDEFKSSISAVPHDGLRAFCWLYNRQKYPLKTRLHIYNTNKFNLLNNARYPDKYMLKYGFYDPEVNDNENLP